MYCDQDDVWFKDKVVLLKEILHHEKSLVKIPLLVHADCFVTDESLVVKVCLKR
jgi:hypothetical protein